MKRLVFIALLVLAGHSWAQSAAQPTLPTIKLDVDGKTITAELADDTTKRQTGLMFREKLAPDSGMLFVMPRREQAVFWMKNTKLPLSVAYLNAAGMILEIHSLKPFDETPVPSAFPTIAYALEMEQGWFDKNSIFPGDRMLGLPPPPPEGN